MTSASYIFYIAFALILFIEHHRPLHDLENVRQRWLTNFSLYFFGLVSTWVAKAFVVYLLPLHNDLFDTYLIMQFWLVQFLLIDVYQYWIHRLMHKVRFLWSIHLVHHSDVSIDVSTNFRHHPIEYLLSVSVFLSFAFFMKIEGNVIIWYGIISTVIAMWHHSNINIPYWLNYYGGFVFITPQIHQVHHQSKNELTDSNFGTIFSFWDRLFGTFNHQYHLNKDQFGLEYFNDKGDATLMSALNQPVKYLSKRALVTSKNAKSVEKQNNSLE